MTPRMPTAHELIGSSRAMQDVRAQLERLAETDCPILVTGECGTGKEVVARWIHQRCPRSGGRFLSMNCAAIPHAYMERELFGHTRGTLTHVDGDHQGLFERVQGGTAFLDEIGDMPLDLQPKLLRALERRSVRPLESTHEIPFDARVVASTSADLELMVEAGRFRADLYYRIDVLSVSLPPLRARGDDVRLLAEHFISEAAARTGKRVEGIDDEAASRLSSYAWPGNVRELEECIERAVTLTRFDRITLEDLPSRLLQAAHKTAWTEDGTPLPLHEVERRHILKVLDAARGNKCRAARILGVDRKTLARKLDHYAARGIDRLA